MMKYPIGLSRNVSKNAEEILKEFPKAGVSHLELSPLDIEDFQEYPLDFKHISKVANDNGVKIWSCHLPFWPFDLLDISKKQLSAQTVAYAKEIIDRASEIGVDKFVIHASGEPIEDSERQERMQCAQESLFILAEHAKKRGGVIAVEDLPRTCLGRNADEVLQLISAHEDLRVCFDTNHLLDGEDPAAFIRKVGKKLITLHVSDYDFTDEKHWLPGEGLVDWQLMYQSLRAVGYSGVWLYELNFHNDKISRTRDLTCEDFVRNAKEIFEGAPLTSLLTKE